MKTPHTPSLMWLGALLLAAPAASAGPPPGHQDPGFGASVMGRSDDLYRGRRSHGVMQMRIQTRHFTRSLELESWSLGKDHSLVRIRKPLKEAGTATLKAGKDLFIYLNKTDRTVKITSGMLGGAWMGSHLTNDDLVHDARLDRDYRITLAGRGQEAGVPVYRFSLQARPQAVVVWDRLLVTVRQADLLPVRQAFFDEAGKQVRELWFDELKELGGRVVPLRMRMVPRDPPGEQTEVRVVQMDFSVELTPAFFSMQQLRSRR